MKSRIDRKFVGRPRNVGAALVVTLALVVLITTLLLAFFINSTLNGQLEVSSTSRVETNIIARSALELIVSDLRQEMMAGSEMAGEVMMPSTNANNMAMRPSRVLADAAMLTNSAFDTLVKQSVAGSAIFPSTAPYTNNGISAKIGPASAINTLSAARNNRKISLARWNFPALVGSNGFTSAAQTPNWIYLGKDGVTNGASANIVGRFAFNVYNVGGRLNVNVAGYPSGLTLEQQEMIKGTPIGAILQNKIPGLLNAAAFINWRNSASSALNPTNFVNAILSDTNGFSQPLAGDNRFITRQDLIRYARLNPTVISTNALPYLTTFSLERNTPSWGPMTNGVGAAYSYASAATNSASTNRFLPAARKSSGEPLISKRFSLDRLNIIPASGAGLATEAKTAILSGFGLQWEEASGGNPASWKYVQKTSSGKIATLEEVAVLNREPNFFELLKVIILSGSLGKSTGDGLSANSAFDQNSDLQIIQIGCNIIDQYRPDDFPTVVSFDAAMPSLSGVVDLPYVNKIANMFYRPPNGTSMLVNGSTTSQSPERWVLGAWWVPEFWRLHQRSMYGPSSDNQSVRLRVENGVMGFNINCDQRNITMTKDVAGAALETVVDANGFRNHPDFVRSGGVNAGVNSEYGRIVDTEGFEKVGSLWGINIGFLGGLESYGVLNGGYRNGIEIPNPDGSDIRNKAMMESTLYPVGVVNLGMEVVLPDGTWANYDRVKNYRSDNASITQGLEKNNSRSGPDFNNTYYMPRGAQGDHVIYLVRGYYYYNNYFRGMALMHAVPLSAFGRSDPRTDRFGLSGFMAAQSGLLRAEEKPPSGILYYDSSSYPVVTVDDAYDKVKGGQKATQKRAAANAGQFSGVGWNNYSVAGGNYPGALTDNTPGVAGKLYYVDNDGIQRRALGAYSSYLMNQTNRAPIMLNRRFFSVADIGYAHRGEPWKNLDLFTKESADAGLLDVFTTTDQGKVTEGKVDLNSAPKEVLSAYLDGVIENEVAGTAISSTTADSIAETIYDEARQKPLVNKSELVTRFSDTSPLRTAINNPDKARHEAYLRGLADNVQTRTWNLMIDVIAQKGRLATPSNLNSFMVEGERRYWLHVAIDRFTGEIVGQRLEAVYE